jgi:hypothetical protein
MDFEGSGFLEIFSESLYSVVFKLESVGAAQLSGQATNRFSIVYSASGSLGSLGSSKIFVSPYKMKGGLNLLSTSARIYDANLNFGFESTFISYGNGDPDFNISLTSTWQANSGNYYWYRVLGCCRVYPDKTPEAVSYFGRHQINPIVSFNENELKIQELDQSLKDPKCGPNRLVMTTAVIARDLDEVCRILKNPKLGPRVVFQIISVKKYLDPIGTKKRSISSDSLAENGAKPVIQDQEFCNLPECLDLCLDFDLAEEASNSTIGSYRPIVFNMSVILDIFYHESNGLIKLSGSAQILYLNKTGSGGIEFSGSAQVNSPSFSGNSSLILNLSGDIEFRIDPVIRSFSGSIGLSSGALDFVSPSINYNSSNSTILIESNSEISFLILYNSYLILNPSGVAETNVDQTYYYEPSGFIAVDSYSSFGSSYYESEFSGLILLEGFSGDIVSANRQYTAQGQISLSGSPNKFGRCFESQNQILISGSSESTPTPSFLFAGGLELGGVTSDIVSPNRIFTSRGPSVDFDGSSDVSFTNFGLLVAYANFYSSYSNLSIDSSSKVATDYSDLTINKQSFVSCGCLSIGLNVDLFHNLAYSGSFSNFLNRNTSIFFDSNINLRYRLKTNSWYNTVNFSGLSEDNQNVSWQFIFELSCTNLIENQTYENQSIKFNLLVRYQKPKAVFKTNFITNIDPSFICRGGRIDNRNRLSSTITYDTYNSNVTINSTNNSNSISNNYFKLIDEIGLFTNDYWGKKVDRSPSRQKYCAPGSGKSSPKIVGTFPQFRINYNNVNNNIDDAIKRGCGVTLDNPIRNNV